MNRKNGAANAGGSFRWLSIAWLSIAMIIAMSCAFSSASTVSGQFVAHNTPRYVATAKNLGAEDPAKVIEVSLWLQLHNRSQFDALTQSLYDPSSPNYRHWLKSKDISARFGPTAEEAKTVRQFFTDHNLTVVKTGPSNFYVRARGTVGDVEKAFHVQLNNYQLRGKTVRANVGDPYVEGAAGALVRAVSGLDSGGFEQQYIVRPNSIDGTQTAMTGVAKPAAMSNDEFFSSQCFAGTETETFSSDNNGSLPIATFSGNKMNLASQTSVGCAYTPPMIQTAYNLTGLYKEKRGGHTFEYDGTDQVIAIIDWCGTPTILSDVNAFSAQFGLPQLIDYSQHQQPFLEITYTAPNNCENWDNLEINLDVEWAHAVAPYANINLVVPPSNSFQDVDEAEFLVVHDGLGIVLSGSYGVPEWDTPTAELETESLIAQIGATEGISTNYATGDDGDWTFWGLPQTVDAPADSPWATAVGGISLALTAKNTIAWQSGWGTNWSTPVIAGVINDPPGMAFQPFLYGSGGGTSNCVYEDQNLNCLGGFPKPSYQSQLPGIYRKVPDISWLADPTMGVAVLISIPGFTPPQVWQVVGGTSVATPMFSALWAIANQEAQFSNNPLPGQAAPYLYSMPAGTIYDILPIATSKHNVTESIQDSSGTTKYNMSQVFDGPAEINYPFLSALWDYPYEADTLVVYAFDTDCQIPHDFSTTTFCDDPNALATQPGWDNVTGMGVPNAKKFADYFRDK
jgi:subtilase family serine protease